MTITHAAPSRPVDNAPPVRSPEPVRKARSRVQIHHLSFGLALIVISVVLLWSFAPALFTSHNPILSVPSEKLLPPSPQHWFGTDHLGRDVYARVVHGSWQSVSSALLAVLIGLVTGSVIGLVAGYAGRLTDSVLSRCVDALLAIPSLLLAMIVVAALGFATINVAIAVGVSSIALFARVVRAEVLRLSGLRFIESAVVVGGRRSEILIQHIAPHIVPTVSSLVVLQFGAAILAISSLAFLGYGSPPPAPDWGLLVSEGRNYLNGQPWLVLAPSFVIVTTVLAFHRVSRGIHPKERR